MKPREFFERLNKDTMPLVFDFYAEEAVFQDPIGILKGPAAIQKHYAHQYERVTAIRWEFEPEIRQNNQETLIWRMIVSHPALNSGKEISVDGVSIFRFGKDQKVIYHRDYFDMGEFVYERIPGLGWLLNKIKGTLTPTKP